MQIQQTFQVQGSPKSGDFRALPTTPEQRDTAQRLCDFVTVQSKFLEVLAGADETILDFCPGNPELVEVGSIRASLEASAEGKRVKEASYSNLAAGLRPPGLQDDLSYRLLADGTQQWHRVTFNHWTLPGEETICYNPTQQTLTWICPDATMR